MSDKFMTATIMDERVELSISDICRVCNCHPEWILELVNEGILDPIKDDQKQLYFSGLSIQKVYTAMRLKRDLGLNLAGIALTLDLLQEVKELREQLSRADLE